MITVSNLSKKFGGLVVLENLSVEINKGEIISIIGPSGCGKSTLLRCLNLLERPTGGEIFVDGEDILAKSASVNELRRKMGMVFQSFNLYSHLLAIENIMLGPVKLLKLPKQQAFDEAKKYLEMVGLSQKAYAYPDELSGGQKQRVAIARTLAMKPEIILFDEPTSALDPTMVSEVLAVIKKLAEEGLTMMIVTHEMKFARDVSTRILYMDDCGIFEEGAPEQIFDSPRRSKTRIFIYKIRSFSYDIDGAQFDLYELNARLEEFLKKRMFTDKKIKTVQLLSEELLCNVLPDTRIEYSVEYSDETGETAITATYAGAGENPFIKKEDDLPLMIIKKSAKETAHHFADGKNSAVVKL
jgi:polar amino acid transport system ATP-binding protein